MKQLLILFFILLSPALCAQEQTDNASRQGASANDETVVFTPIYGRDAELNDLLTYITNWVILHIPADQKVHKVNGVIKCHFMMDSVGKIIYIRMGNNKHPWMAYAIAEALNTMPAYDSPLTRDNNFSQNLYFSFGPDHEKGFNSNAWEQKTTDGLQHDLQAQKKERSEATKEHYRKFDKVRTENMMDAMTQEMKKTLQPDNGHLDPIVPQVPITPAPPPPTRTSTRISVSVE